MQRHVRQLVELTAPLREPIGDGHGPARVTGSIAGGVLAFVAGLEGVHVGWLVAGVLLLVLLLVSTLELWTGYAVATPEERKGFDLDRKVTRKFLRFAVVVLASLLDAALYTVAHYLPHRFAVLEMGFMFFAITTMLWYVAGDGARILLHVGRGHPEDVPPQLASVIDAIQFFLRTIKRVDRARWQKAGHDGDPPERRRTDQLTDVTPEELARVLEEIRRREPPPTEPENILNNNPNAGDVT